MKAVEVYSYNFRNCESCQGLGDLAALGIDIPKWLQVVGGVALVAAPFLPGIGVGATAAALIGVGGGAAGTIGSAIELKKSLNIPQSDVEKMYEKYLPQPKSQQPQSISVSAAELEPKEGLAAVPVWVWIGVIAVLALR